MDDSAWCRLPAGGYSNLADDQKDKGAMKRSYITFAAF
jgi:hypothetical protein